MTTFLISLVILVGGYCIYGLFAEKVFGIDPSRETPAMTQTDGIDFVPMSTWRVFLIQFLNIAGMGPIFGAIMGIMFGPAAFLWIVLGTIFAGAVHDFTSAMISLRSNGASLPEIVGNELGSGVKHLMRVFTLALLVLLGAVFVVSPAEVLNQLTPDWCTKEMLIVAIFVYYFLATMLPIDKLIGRIYPLFGGALLFMAVGLMGYMFFSGEVIPDGMTEGLFDRHADAADGLHPIFPMLCISIACGAISGFHATQSTMMAKCLKNEKLARPIFYGAMVAEGIVALIWAAAAITFAHGYDGLTAYMAQDGNSASTLVSDISFKWLGAIGGVLAVLGVVAAPISTGDTALRSARLILSETFHLPQKKIINRLLICIPLFAATVILMNMEFSVLWRYFGWCNQTLAVFTLWACTVYLCRHNRFYFITLVPALFMQFVVISFILLAPVPEGFGLDHTLSYGVAGITCVITLGLFGYYSRQVSARPVPEDVEAA